MQRDLEPIKIDEQLRRFGLRNFVNHHGHFLYESTVNTVQLSVSLRVNNSQVEIIAHPPDIFTRNRLFYSHISATHAKKCKDLIEALHVTGNGHIVDHIKEKLEPIQWGDSPTIGQTGSNDEDDFQAQLQNFESLGQLGQGSFGVVWEILHKTTKMRSALKAIKLDDTYNLEKAEKEVKNAQEIFKYKDDARLRYVINIWDSFYVSKNESNDVKTWILPFWLTAYPPPHGFYFIHMELCTDFTLERWLKNPETNANLEEGRRLFSHIAQGLACLHDNNCIHRDLSPVNILLTRVAAQGKSGNEIVAKISDFGKSRIRLPDATSTLTIKAGGEFNSPEISEGKKYTIKTDIYSLGLILFCILYPIRPNMDAKEYHENFKRLKEKRPKIPPGFLEKFSREAELLRKMFAFDPNLRPDANKSLRFLENRNYDRTGLSSGSEVSVLQGQRGLEFTSEQLRRFGLSKFVSQHNLHLFENTVNTAKLAVALCIDDIKEIVDRSSIFESNRALYNYAVATHAEKCEAVIGALYLTGNGHIISYITKQLESNDGGVSRARNNPESFQQIIKEITRRIQHTDQILNNAAKITGVNALHVQGNFNVPSHKAKSGTFP